MSKVPEYRLVDEHGIDRGVIEETSVEDSADPDFIRYAVYVKAGTAWGPGGNPDARARRAAELWAPLADLTDEDWRVVFAFRPDLKARLKATPRPAGGESR